MIALELRIDTAIVFCNFYNLVLYYKIYLAFYCFKLNYRLIAFN